MKKFMLAACLVVLAPQAFAIALATPDARPRMMAVVLIRPRVLHQGGVVLTVPVCQVLRELMLPTTTTYSGGRDTKLVPAGTMKVGDTAPSGVCP